MNLNPYFAAPIVSESMGYKLNKETTIKKVKTPTKRNKCQSPSQENRRIVLPQPLPKNRLKLIR
jgi:hypothetical protein